MRVTRRRSGSHFNTIFAKILTKHPSIIACNIEFVEMPGHGTNRKKTPFKYAGGRFFTSICIDVANNHATYLPFFCQNSYQSWQQFSILGQS